jgi:hypothetical protein
MSHDQHADPLAAIIPILIHHPVSQAPWSG